jgi:glycerol-3-phosphate dehydrogenase (NAD(P)+)
MRIGVLGLGSWGTALAVRLARQGHAVRGWEVDPAQREALRRDKVNRKYLPGLALPSGLAVVDTVEAALAGAEIAVFVVPSFAVRETARAAREHLGGIPAVNAAKGLEEGTRARMLQVLAEEVALDYPTAVVAASRWPDVASRVQTAFADETFRIYTNDDVVGVELAVSLKNVIALASGIALGLGYGDNTLGALLTRGLAEITRLGAAMGARPETFFGLAGVGDLVTTCASPHSRNRRVGESIGRGKTLDETLAGMTMVAEGVRTTRAARELARETGTNMPIVDRVHAVLFEGESPRAAIRDLMTREPKAEPEHGGAG